MGAEPPGHARKQGLLEREVEFAALGEAFGRLASGSGSLILVEGPAGIGKTALLEEAVTRARRQSAGVLRSRGGELEREMPFGVARQLFEPVIERAPSRQREALLTGSAELALTALGRAEVSQDGELDPFAPIHGLYWLVSNLAEQTPVTLVVDDAHWLDSRTLDFLLYLARRLDDVAVLVVAAIRSGEPGRPSELERLSAEAEILRPAPLSHSAVDRLIAAKLDAQPAPQFSAACSDSTGGNPFLVTEVTRTLRADGIAPSAAAAESIAAVGAESIARYVLTRLRGFGPEALELANAIAILGTSSQLRHATALAGLTQGRAVQLCDRLRAAQIFSPELPVEFVHPVVRSVIYRELPSGERSALHRRAADVLSRAGVPPEEISPHLLACEPNGDAWVVEQLQSAASAALAAGAPGSAAAFLERALSEPPEDETPLLYLLGLARKATSPWDAAGLFARVADRAPTEDLRRDARWECAFAYFSAGALEQAADWQGQLVDALPAGSERALIEESQLYCMRLIHRGREMESARRLERVAQGVGTRGQGERLIRQAQSIERFADCAGVDEVTALAASFSPPPFEPNPVGVIVPALACKVLAWSGRWVEAREATERGLEGARSRGLLLDQAYSLGFLAEIDRLAGRLADSEGAAQSAWDLLRDLAPETLPAWSAMTNLAATLIARGERSRALDVLGPRDLSAKPSAIPMTPYALEIRASIRMASGEWESAVDDWLELGEDLETLGIRNPAQCPWRQEAAPALAALGRTAEARELISIAEERVRRFGAAHAIGGVLRARGMIEPRTRSIGTLRDSIAALEDYGPPHELARSLLELGAAMRRNGERADSREPLRQALDLAHRSGATGVEERAREELAAAGSRPRRAVRTGVAALTPSELRTARLAAEGLGNVEIAQHLFVTRKTVEKHLGNAYSKLEISGREYLPQALAE